MNHDNRIADILDGIEAVHTNDRLSIDWKGHYPEAMRIARELGMPPEKMAEPNCLTCQLEVLNTLRTSIGLKDYATRPSEASTGRVWTSATGTKNGASRAANDWREPPR